MFGMVQGLGDFVGGFNKESNTIRQEQQAKSDQDAAIEQRALEHLANADDPNIRAAAVTAMLTPKKQGAASGMAKWFNQQRSHPIFDQVNQLMGGGAQPFMSPEDKAAAVRAGTVQGAGKGYAAGLREEGYEPTAEGLNRVVSGAAGAPISSRLPLSMQAGTIFLKDGTKVQGNFDKVYGGYSDADDTPINAADIDHFEPAATRALSPSAGGTWTVVKDPNSPTGYSRVHGDAAGKEIGRILGVQGPPPEPLSFIQTPNGLLTGGTHTGVVKPAIGGENVSQPAPATSDYETLKSLSDEISKRANAGVFHAAGLPVDQKELGPKLDAEAKLAGWKDWATLQAALGQAQAAVGARVQPPPQPPADVSAPIQGRPAPTPRRTAPPPTKEKKPPAKGNPAGLDVQKILQELNKF